jgi:hypothetical protein
MLKGSNGSVLVLDCCLLSIDTRGPKHWAHLRDLGQFKNVQAWHAHLFDLSDGDPGKPDGDELPLRGGLGVEGDIKGASL